MLATLYFVLALLPLVFGDLTNVKCDSNDCKEVCQAISATVSSKSTAFYPGGDSSVPKRRSSSPLLFQEAKTTKMIYLIGLPPARNSQLAQLNLGVHMT